MDVRGKGRTGKREDLVASEVPHASVGVSRTGPVLLWFRRDLRLTDNPPSTAPAEPDARSSRSSCSMTISPATDRWAGLPGAILQCRAAFRALDDTYRTGQPLPGVHTVLATLPPGRVRRRNRRTIGAARPGGLAGQRSARRLAAALQHPRLGSGSPRGVAARRSGRTQEVRCLSRRPSRELPRGSRPSRRDGHQPAIAPFAFRGDRTPADCSRPGRDSRTGPGRLPARGRLARVQSPPAVPSPRNGIGESA